MEKQSSFKSFLLSEYSSLGQAHFNTIQSISSFFHYYILILTASIAGGGLFVNYLKGAEKNLAPILPFLIVSLAIISLVGFFLLVYISNLRFDAILYARSVNGIRKFFYNNEGFSPAAELHMRPLPRVISFPRFYEPRYFLAVAITFGLLNSFSLGLSFVSCRALYSAYGDPFLDSVLILTVVLFFGSHIWFYYSLAQMREKDYVRTNWIGIDIDGVLNRHREQFCLFMRFLFRKRIKPANITTIPVHDCKQLNIPLHQEREVFHHPEYWKRMQSFSGAAEIIDRLQNSFGYKIHVITSRPWPNFRLLDKNQKKRYKKLWRFKNIKTITKKWLHTCGIRFNRFTIEGDNSISFSPNVNYNNRFWLASKDRFRMFIEDDLPKAIKLTHICDVVFLIDQPYNQSDSYMPANLIRVKEWKEILHYVRENL